MLIKLSQIISFGLCAFFLSLILYPFYIRLLKRLNAGQNIRESAATGDQAKIYKQLHQHKQGTPRIGGGLFLIIMLVMILASYCLQQMDLIKYTLWNTKETKIILFGFFSMGLIGLVDDILNTKGYGKIKGLSAKMKLIGMFIFAAFISRWFYYKLGVSTINFRPIAGEIDLGIFYPILTFFITISIVNAINITDGLDGLAGGLMSLIFFVLAIVTFSAQTYIATTVLVILISILLAFMMFNVYPAKVFMGDSGAFALGGFLSSLIFFMNMRTGIIIPFLVIFLLFIVDTASSAIQMLWKKFFKRKLLAVSPLHHYFEHKGIHEATIVMKAWILQGILAAVAMIGIFYQISVN